MLVKSLNLFVYFILLNSSNKPRIMKKTRMRQKDNVHFEDRLSRMFLAISVQMAKSAALVDVWPQVAPHKRECLYNMKSSF